MAHLDGATAHPAAPSLQLDMNARTAIAAVGVLMDPLDDRHGAGSLHRAGFSEFDKALSIKLWKTKTPKPFVQEDEAGSLGTTDVLPDLFQVLAMERDEIAEELDVARLARRCRLLAIDPPLDINAPFLRVLSAEKCLVDIFPLSSDLDSPGA